MIISSDFLNEIKDNINLGYFTNEYIEKVANWILNYYSEYGKAPGKHIEDIYEFEKPKLKEQDADLIYDLLIRLDKSNVYDTDMNIPFISDEATRFFKKRELEITCQNTLMLLEKDRVEDAEHEFYECKKIERVKSSWVSPLSDEEVVSTFEQKGRVFFQFPGKLGEFLGPMNRGWLIGITGPFKRGKTWLAQEFMVVGVTLFHIPTIFISLEMPKNEMKERLYKRLVPSFGENGGVVTYPCFDCVKNQDDTCRRSERRSRSGILDEDGNKLIFSPDLNYSPCTWCRLNLPGNYKFTTWFESIEQPAYDSSISSKLKIFNKHYGHLIRTLSYPKYSANFSDIKRDIEILMQRENFIPGMIVIDMVDILAAEKGGLAGIAKEDESWMAASRLAGEFHSLLITPTQATREALTAKNVTQEHTSKWIGKLGHVEGMMAMNQTPDEKDQGIMRLSWMAHRHQNFREDSTVTVLQQLTTGQVNLDSET